LGKKGCIGIELNGAHRRGVREASVNEYSTACGSIESCHRISITVHLQGGRCNLVQEGRRVNIYVDGRHGKMPSNSITVLSLHYFHLSHASRYQLYKHPSTQSTNSHSNKSLISCPDKLPQNGIAASHSAAIRIIISPPNMI